MKILQILRDSVLHDPFQTIKKDGKVGEWIQH